MTGTPDESEWLPRKTETVEYMYGQWKRQTYQEDGTVDQDNGAEPHRQDHPQAKEEPAQVNENHLSYQEAQTQTRSQQTQTEMQRKLVAAELGKEQH